ncbi:MAG: sigma-70 family RNA polymerase sigma factor [Clostridium sp.]
MVNKENFIEKLQQRDMQALEYVFDKYSDLIYRVGFKVTNNKELSEECLNTVLMKIWEKIDSYVGNEDGFEAWIFSIAKFCAIDILRKEVRHFKAGDIDDRDEVATSSIEEQVEIKDDLKRVMYEIEKLGDLDKEIFIRRFMLNHRVKDIALHFEMTEKAVSLRILRSRKKLKKVLEVV